MNGAYDPATPDEDVASTTTYDAWGRTLAVADPDGVTTTTGYSTASSSANGYLTDALTVSDGLGNVTTRAHDPVGRVTSVTTPKNETTTTTYNLAGNPVRITAPDGTISQATYDAWGFKTADIANYVNGVPSTGGIDDLVSAYTYDRFGNLVQTDRDCASGTGGSCTGTGFIDARTVSSYDLARNVVATTVYTGSGTGGSARTTTRYWETSTTGGATVARPAASGVRAPIYPSGAPAPVCPGTASTRCSSAAIAGSASGLDLRGQTVGVTDATGAVTRTLRDVAGRPVFTIANYVDGVYDTAAPDTDIVTTMQYDLAGQVVRAVDVLGRASLTTRDALGRAITVTTKDSAGADVNVTKTVYTPGGRVDRTSAPDAVGLADTARSWSKTVYDRAGRATKTLARHDTTGAAGLAIDSFEGPTLVDETIAADGVAERWDSAAGVFIAAGASATENHAAAGAVRGVSTLDVTPTATGRGVEWKLDGTFISGRTYKASVWAKVPAGTTLTIRFGTAADPASPATGTITGNSAWQQLGVPLSWTPTANRTGAVLAAYPTSGTGAFSLDDAVVWDNATPDLNAVSSETAYDANGAIVRTVLPPGVPGTDEPLVTTTTRDSLGRPTVVTVNAIAGAGTGDTTSNLASTTHYDPLGRVDYALDVASRKTTFTLDRLARATAVIENDTGAAPSAVTDDHDVKSSFAYNALGELTAYCPAVGVTLFGAGTPCSPTATSGEAYERGWHWTYDDAGHREGEIAPVNVTATARATVSWTYDAAGLLLSEAVKAGKTTYRHTDSTYDDVGRLTQAVIYEGKGGSTPRIRTTTSYLGDGAPAGQAVYLNGSGTASDSLSFTYDTAGRPDQVKRASTVLTDFGWNADGTLATRIDGDAGAVGTTSFTYDWAKRLSTATLPSGWQTGGNSAAWTYRADGLLATRTYNGASNPVTYGYDAAKRPTSATKTLASGSLNLTQAYDRLGNVTSEGRSITGPTGDAGTNTQSFTYDNLDRLTGSSGLAAGNRTYTWDLNGNRRTKADGADTYAATYDRTDALLQVSKNGGVAVTASHDVYGNLTSNPEAGTTAGLVAMTYDLADRTLSITPAGGTATTLVLDALGRPRTRATGSSVDTLSYAGVSNHAVRIANSGGSGTTTDSVLDPAGIRLGTKTGSTVAWLVPDLHGSIAAGLNQAADTVTDALRYDGAGVTVATWPGGGSAATKHWKYQGRLDVSVAGPSLYDFEAREMSPGLGTFTSIDTLTGDAGNPLQLNRYRYAGSNPTTFIDPDGHAIYSYDYEDDPGWSDSPTGEKVSNADGTAWTPSTTTSSATTSSTPISAVQGNAPPPNTPIQIRPMTGCGLLGASCWWGFAQGVADTLSGFARGTVDLAACAADPWCAAEAIKGGVRSIGAAGEALITDLPGSAGRALIELGDWVGREHSLLTSEDSPEAWREAGRLFAGIEAGGLTAGRATAVRGAAATAGSGPVQFLVPRWATAEEVAQMRAYCQAANCALAAGALSPSGRVSTGGALAAQAQALAAAERARAALAGTPYRGVVGHGPDATWMGVAAPWSWIDMTRRVNSSLAGQSSWYLPGWRPTRFELVFPK